MSFVGLGVLCFIHLLFCFCFLVNKNLPEIVVSNIAPSSDCLCTLMMTYAPKCVAVCNVDSCVTFRHAILCVQHDKIGCSKFNNPITTGGVSKFLWRDTIGFLILNIAIIFWKNFGTDESLL